MNDTSKSKEQPETPIELVRAAEKHSIERSGYPFPEVAVYGAFVAGANWQSLQQKEQPWVRVEDGLPEPYKENPNFSKTVIVTDGKQSYGEDNTEMGFYSFVINVWIITGDNKIEPTHWIPLPAPPKD